MASTYLLYATAMIPSVVTKRRKSSINPIVSAVLLDVLEITVCNAYKRNKTVIFIA